LDCFKEAASTSVPKIQLTASETEAGVVVNVTNNSGRTMWINRRFAPGTSLQLPAEYELQLQVKGPKLQLNRMQVQGSFAEPSDYVEVQPGEVISSVAEVLSFDGFPLASGMHEVRVCFWDRSELRLRGIDDSSVMRGPAASTWIEMLVKGK